MLCLTTMLLGSLALAECPNETVLPDYTVTMDEMPAGYEMQTLETELGTYLVADKVPEVYPAIAGGWNLNADPDNDTLEIFYKAAGDGTELQPMALLGTQVVAGTNYAVLCADAEGWKIAYVYAALDGTATLERVQMLLPMGEQPGAWQIMTPECDDYDTAYEKTSEALNNMLGASYDQKTLLASQLVNGTNYAVLARKTLVTAEPIANWALVTVHVDFDGNASVIDVQDVGLSLAE